MASRNIQYKGSFDVSQILASFKQIRNEAEKSNISDKLLGGYDKELEKVEKLTTQILAAQSRGLTDNLSIKEFARLVSQLEKQYGILNVKAQAFTDAANYKTETAEIKQYSNQLKTLIDRLKSLEKSARDYIDANSDALKLSKEESKALKLSISDAQAYKDVLDEIVLKRIDAAKQKIADRSLSTTGGSLKYAEITGLTANFTLSAADKKGRDTSRKSLVGRNGLFDETKAITVANLEYNRILEDAIVNNRTAEDALQEMIKTMRAYKLELGDTEEVLKKFALDLASIKDAAWENHGNLTGNDKGAFTRVEHKVDAIKSNASGLYNNVSVVLNTLVGQTIDLVNRQKIKSETEYNRQVELTISLQLKLRQQANDTAENIISGLKAEIAESQKNLEIKNTIEDSFNKIGQGAKQILSVTTAWRSLRNVVRNTFNDVKALDKSFASIAMVTEYSVKDMWLQYGQYAEMANRLGQSTQSVVEASGLYYQQGLKTNEVLKLTEETMKLATLAGLDFKEATSQMTAALRAFHMDMSEGAHVTDVYAEVAAHAAVDVQGLSEAMSATAAIANSAGMSFENTTAMLATMVEATQEAPKNLGTAMKTIIARFTELKENVAGTADSEFDDLDYNKVDKALKSVGVSLKDATGQFRNMDEVFLELSSKWNTLDRNSLRYIATIAAGSRQQSRFIALMENYERTMELVDVALNSAGRSSQQFAKYLDTVEYRLNKIKNSWEQFRTSLLDSDAYKGALDAFGDFLNKLNDMSGAGLATLAGTWLTFGRKAISGTLNNVSNIFSNISIGDKAKQRFFEKNKNQDGYTIFLVDTGQTITNNEALEKAWETEKPKLLAKGSSIGTAIATSITTSVTAGLTAGSPWKAAGAAMASSLVPNLINGFQAFGPKGLIVGAIMTVVNGAVSGIINKIKQIKIENELKTNESLVKRAEQEVKRLDELIEANKSKIKGDLEEIKTLKDIQKEYDEIGKKTYRNSEELERFNKLVTNLQENYPDLIKIYNSETGELELQNKLLEEKITKTELLLNIAGLAVVRDSIGLVTEQMGITSAKNNKKLIEQLDKNYSSAVNIRKEGFKVDYDRYIGPESSTIADIAQKFNYDIDATLTKILDDYKNISLELIDLIRQTLESFKPEEYDFSKLAQSALLYINNSTNKLIQQASESAKNSLSIALTETYTRVMKSNLNEGDIISTIKNYDDLDKDEKRNFFSRIRNLGSKEFKDYFTSDSIYGTLGDLRENQDFEDYSENLLKVLKKIGITTKEELKTFNDNYSTTYEKTEAFINKFTDAALASKGLTEQLIQGTIKLDSQLLKIYNSDKSIEQVEQEINLLRLGYNFEGSQKIIDEYDEERTKYKDFLKANNLNNSEWAKLSIKNIKIVRENLEKYVNLFKGMPKVVELSANELLKELQNSGVSSKGLSALYDIDYTELSQLSFDEAALKMAEKLEAADAQYKDVGIIWAKKILTGLSDKGLVPFISDSAAALSDSIEKALTEKIDFTKNYKSVLDKISSDFKNLGHIDIFNLEDIKKQITQLNLDPNDFIYTDLEGNFLIYYQDLIDAAKEQLGTEEDFIAQKEKERLFGITLLELEIQTLKNARDGISLESQKLKVEQLITLQKYALARAEGRAIEDEEKVLSALNIDTTQKLSEDLKKLIDREIESKELQLNMLKNINITEEAKKEFLAIRNLFDGFSKDYLLSLKDLEKEKDKAYKDWQDKTKAVADAQKSLAKAIETVAEKQKELKATIEGTNWKSSIDGMYNYNTALDFLTKQTERAKKDLEKASTIDAAKRNFAVYGQGLLDQKAQLQAQNLVYRTAYNNIGRVYNNDVAKLIKSFEDSGLMKFNLADYLVFDEKTGTKINMNALQKAKMPEALKKWIETLGQKANEYLTKIWDNDDKVKLLNEEFIEHQRQALDGYVELQDKMIEVLREKYQKQVDDLRTKYEAMNEADDLYLNALLKNIDKQRKLRDLERSWNELENKERKLALLRRDTSRGNAVEVKSLEKEVQDDRTSLLDSAVDDIIEKLREFYELQKELRELEITYQEALIDDVALMKEATEALLKILTSDELVNWWKKNVTEMEKMSDEKLLQEKLDWEKLFNKKTLYVTSVDETVLKSIQNSEKNLKDVADKTEEIVRTTSEGITELASKSLEEAGEEYKKAVKTAKDALLDAVDAVAKLKEALLAAIDAANESKKAFDDIAAKYKETLSKNTLLAYVLPNGTKTTDPAEVKRYWESKPQNERVGGTPQQEVPVKDIKKSNTTPYSNTSSILNTSFKEKDLKTFIIGLSGDTVKLFTSTSELSSTNSSIPASTQGKGTTYTNKGRVTIPEDVKHGVLTYNEKDKKWELLKPFDKLEDAEKYIKQYAPPSMATTAEKEKYRKNHLAFAEGGLVNFTGPAWVDGSRSRPEAFLSAEDTRRIGEAARILADLPILSQPVNQEQLPTTTIGDTTIQIDVHVDSIASDYDLDEAMDKVEKRIVEAAKYTGSNVILKKR